MSFLSEFIISSFSSIFLFSSSLLLLFVSGILSLFSSVAFVLALLDSSVILSLSSLI
jgi:hypothetical protein